MKTVKSASSVLCAATVLLAIGQAWAYQDYPQDIGDLVYRDSNFQIYGRDGVSVSMAINHPGHVAVYVGNGKVVEALGHGLWIFPGVTGEVMETPLAASPGVHSYYEQWSNNTADYDGVADHGHMGAKTHNALLNNPNALTLRQNIKMLALNQVGEGYDNDFSDQKGPGADQWTCVGLAESVYEWCAGQTLPSQYASYGDQSQYAGGLNITPDGYEYHSWDVIAYYQNNVEFSQIPTTLLLGRQLDGSTFFVFFPYTQFQQPTLIDAFHVPAAPASLSAVAVSSSQINLTWGNVANEIGFKIERRIGSGSFSQIAANLPNFTSFSDTGRAAGTTYSYRVRAFNDAGDSAYSPIASATTQSPPGTSFTLTIASSNPSSGVSVWSCGGSGGCVASATPTSRSFPSGTAVGIACPDTLPGGLVFQKWQMDGNDLAFSSATAVSMNAPHTVTAFFGLTPPPVRVLSSLTIEGPTDLDEETSADYHAHAFYTDGSDRYVDSVATWTTDSGYADFSSPGRLDASAVDSDTDIVVEATFTEGGVTRTATQDVTIWNTDTVPTYTLTLSASHGYINAQPQMSAYPAGTVVRLSANPDDLYLFDHWSGSASGTDRAVYITMDGNRSVTAHFVVDPSYGSLRVNLTPAQAVNEGAQWRYSTFTAWQNSGYLMEGITPRANKNIYFKDIPGWITPDNLKASVVGGQTTVTNATYREILGAVQVTIAPDQANTAGGRWRLDGGPWTESGVTLADASTGNHTVQFLAIAGWTTPPSRTVSVARGVTTTASGDYGPPAGLPIITSVSPRTGPIAGGTMVTLDGANFQAGATVSFGGVAATPVTVVSSTRITAVTPPRTSYGSVALSLVSGGQTVTQANGFSYLNALGSNIELVGQIGGGVLAVAVVGNMVYYGEGAVLVVSDFSDSQHPVERGRIALPGLVNDLVVVSNVAFAALASAGLYAVDVTTPSAPAIVGFFDTEGSARGVAVSGGLAYVADYDAGLQILDVSNPAAIVRRGLLDTTGHATRVAVGTIASKQYAFVVEYDLGLRVIDVTTPGAPVERTNVPTCGVTSTDVRLVGTKLYVSHCGVKIFDASNPTNLIQTGSFAGTRAAIDVVGNRLYTCNSTFHVGDLTVSPNPTNLGDFSLGSYCYKLVVADNLAFCAMDGDGLKVVTVSNPASMSLRSSIQPLGGVEDVWVTGGVAFVGNGTGLHTVDVSNPAKPARLATLPGDPVTGIVVANGKATLVNGSMNVRIANVANPASLTLSGTYTNTGAFRVALMGSTPVLAGERAVASLPKLDVLNISAPSNPQSTGSLLLDTSNRIAIALTIVSNWAFVGREDAALDVVNLANPASPQRVGSLSITTFFGDVAASGDGNYVYLANSALGIQVVDVTVKTNPVMVQVIDPPQTSGSNVATVQVAGNRLFAFESGFVFAFDITTPASPQMIGYYDVPGGGDGIAVVGDLMYVAGTSAGLNILRLMDVGKPTVAITSPTANTAYSTNTALLTLGGTATDDKGVVRVSWENDRGGGGVVSGTTNWQVSGIQLTAGLNTLTVTAEDANGNLATDLLTVTANLPDTTPPVVTITGPKPDAEFTVETNLITLSGSAADNQAVTNLTWSNNRGGSGTLALAGQTWSITNLALALGPNLIQVTATDSSGNIAADTAVIFFAPPDTNAPSIRIEFPTLNVVYETPFGVLDLSGTAADNVGVTEVKWTCSRGGQGVANGVAPWSVNGIALQPGLNIIEVTAADAAGNTATDTLVVTYTPPPLRLNALGVSNGVFRLELSGPPMTCVIQVSADLVHWLPFSTNTIPADGSLIISDPGVSNRPVRFYRAVSLAVAVAADLPALRATRLGSDLLLSWPTNFAGFTLETATNLPPTSWTSNSIPPAIANGQWTVTNAIAGGKKFYRLRK